jgi:endoglucanase
MFSLLRLVRGRPALICLLVGFTLLPFSASRSEAAPAPTPHARRHATRDRSRRASVHGHSRRAAARDRRRIAARDQRREAAARRRRAHLILSRRRQRPGRHHGTTPSSPAGGTTHSGTPTATTTAPVTATPVTTVSAPTSHSDDPLAGDHLYINPNDSAIVNEQSLQAQGQSAEAAQIGVIAAQPEATWLTSDSSASEVAPIMSAAAGAGEVPVFVVYNLPGRDCGSYSAGGASSVGDYESFINQISGALGQRSAVVVLEPDALSYAAGDTCAATQSWYQPLSYAVTQLDTDANASVYVDAGNPGWQSAAAEASGLAKVIGTARAGFSVNVSNFDSTAADVAYGTAISQALGGRHFVIDTSRNGAGVASGQWCNPSGAALGTPPTTDTGNPLVDADLWIKTPGESDGTCNGGPSAGQFWLSYALALVANQG